MASALDRRVDNWTQDQRSPGSDRAAQVFKYGGEPVLIFGVSGGILAAGVISGRPDLERRGGRVLASVVAAGLTTGALKEITGRFRPDNTTDPYVFHPFTNHDAFPSGHATMAFALATSLSAEIHRPWATALLYAGATVGITAANVIEGRWRIFGLGPPRFLIDPHHARLEWRTTF